MVGCRIHCTFFLGDVFQFPPFRGCDIGKGQRVSLAFASVMVAVDLFAACPGGSTGSGFCMVGASAGGFFYGLIERELKSIPPF